MVCVYTRPGRHGSPQCGLPKPVFLPNWRDLQPNFVLWNLCPPTISPTFSFLLTLTHISLLMNSLPLRTDTGTFPHSSPMPCSLRWNSIPFLDALHCFTFLILICLAPLLALWSDGFHFISRIFSSLESAVVPLPLLQFSSFLMCSSLSL